MTSLSLGRTSCPAFVCLFHLQGHLTKELNTQERQWSSPTTGLEAQCALSQAGWAPASKRLPGNQYTSVNKEGQQGSLQKLFVGRNLCARQYLLQGADGSGVSPDPDKSVFT